MVHNYTCINLPYRSDRRPAVRFIKGSKCKIDCKFLYNNKNFYCNVITYDQYKTYDIL